MLREINGLSDDGRRVLAFIDRPADGASIGEEQGDREAGRCAR